VVGEESIGTLAERRDSWKVLISPQRRSTPAKGQHPEDSFGCFEDPSVGFDQLNSARQAHAGKIGEPPLNVGILGGLVIDGLAGSIVPPSDPEPAEPAVAVEDDHRTFGRRLNAL
jgi:hypothetical protein